MSDKKIGGQAVIEGVMMRGPASYSLAIRNPDSGAIEVETFPLKPSPATGPYSWPLIRGVFELFRMLYIGMRTLILSADRATEIENEKEAREQVKAGEHGEEQEPEVARKKKKKTGLTTLEIVFTIGMALGFAILLFIVLPLLFTKWLESIIGLHPFAFNAIDGLFRIVVFFIYLLVIGLLKDIRRVFAYHGAEHKVINAFEEGRELSVAAAREFGTAHRRCGTNFIFLVLVMSILIFSLTTWDITSFWLSLLWKFGVRILLLPLIAGLSYEFLKWSARDAKWGALVAAPGLWLQRLTTREPDDRQLEVALAALKAVLPEDEEKDGTAGGGE